ncbi:MAG TPA: hypothetical protein VK841_19250 [Polyangiaceae bacterium]|jgi:hypothetical protein|nr:hypothetical protein [Polyangiaceae bacterium]
MLSKIATASAATVLLAAAMGARPARADDTSACIAASEAAQSLRDAHSLLQAREKLVLCTRDACPGPIRQDCIDLRAKVDAAMPSVVLRAKNAHGEDVTEGRVLCDGAPLATVLDGKAIAIDPGQHVLRIELPGEAPVERKIVVGEGEKDRLVVIDASPNGPSEPVAPEATGQGAAAESAPPGGWFVPGLVAGSIGVAAAVPMAILWATATSDVHDMRSTCAPSAGGPGCPADRVDSDRTKLIAGDVFLGIAAAGIATGAVLLWIRRPHPTSADASAPSTALGVSAAPVAGGAVASIGGRF